MSLAPPSPLDPGIAPPEGERREFLPRRRALAMVVAAAFVTAAMLLPITQNTYIELVGETLFVAMMLLFAFTAARAWRQPWLPRRLVQVMAVALAAMLSPLLVQLLTFNGNFFAFISSRPHVRGYVLVTVSAAILGTFFSLAALYSERRAQARALVLQFALERETLERQAADARLRLMTAQIQPHFLLNTLANVQELVESGSPRAAAVFRSLIDYLRAAVPRLQREDATIEDEERLVRAYLELMQMRMPDRLVFSVDIAPDLRRLRFPTMALLTLVENAVRHGIDPAVDGGRVEVGGEREGADLVHLWVADSGVGLSEHAGEGTGLANLNARLMAAFGAGARVELSESVPHGVRADIRLRIAA